MRLLAWIVPLLAAVPMSRGQQPPAPGSNECFMLLSQSDRLVEHGMLEHAEELLRRGLSCQERQVPADHPELAADYQKLAELTRWRGGFTEAEGHLRRAVAILSGAGEPYGGELASAYNRLAQVCFDQGRYYEAEPLVRKSKDLAEAAGGRGSEGVAIALNTLGSLHAALKDLEGAEREFRKALAVQKTAGRRNENTATLLHNLATTRFDRGFPQEAEELYLESLRLQEELFGPDRPELRRTLEAYARTLKRNGRKTEARLVLGRPRAFDSARPIP